MKKVITKVYCDLYDSDHNKLNSFEVLSNKTIAVTGSGAIIFYSISNFENEYKVNMADVLTDLKIAF